MATEKIIDKMGRTNYDKSGVEITPETPRQNIVFDGTYGTWPRVADGTRILFSCLTKAEKQAYYAHRKASNQGSSTSNSGTKQSQLKQFSDYWSELAPLLKEEQIVPVFEKTWAVFPGLKLPITTLQAMYPEKNFSMCIILGVELLSLEQVKQL